MAEYRYRTITADGRTVLETTGSAKTMREAIALGFSTARDVKNGQPDGASCNAWFIDILDPSGCWLMSVPFAMVSRGTEASRGV